MPTIEFLEPLNPCPGDKVKLHVKNTPSLNFNWNQSSANIIPNPALFVDNLTIEPTTLPGASNTDEVQVSMVTCGLSVNSNALTIPVFSGPLPSTPPALGILEKTVPLPCVKVRWSILK